MVPCAALILLAMVAQAQAQSVLTRHVRPEVTNGTAKFLNRMPGTQTLQIDMVLPVRDQAELDSFLQEVYDPTSPSYHHFLTVQQFTEKFGPTQQDYDIAVAYAKSYGLSVVGGSRDAMDIQLAGSVTSIEAAFNISMGVYQHPREDRTFYSPDREPKVALPFAVWHISGLNNFSTPQPALVHSSNASGKLNATTGSGPSASFLGSDMRAAYYVDGSVTATLTGTNQYIGLLEYYGYDIADLNTYYSNAGQTSLASKVTGISTDGTSLTCLEKSRCDDTEQILDMTQSLGMAPGITTLYVYVGSTDTAILGAMSSDSPLPLQLSSSWTWTPDDPTTDDPYFKKMATQGQSFFQAAGDSGAWRSSTYPSEDPNVICVGGTDLQTSSAGGPWSSETAWSDGGGGISTDHLAIPTYQQVAGVITTANKGSTTYRNGPDVSANSNFTYYVCADQEACTANEYGGTSFATPLWAGYIALANQQAKSNGVPAVGFLNPTIYPLALTSQSTYFHDITGGSNGYSAIAGYDLATGWGSMNGAALINALAGPATANFFISPSPASVTVIQGNSGTSKITTTALNGFDSGTGGITLSATGMPTGVTAAFGANPIVAPGSGTSLLTLNVAATTVAGTYAITVTGTAGSTVNSTTVILTVTAPANFSISASPTAVSVAQGSKGTSTITTAVSGSFNSAIALSASGQPAGVTVSFSKISIAAPGSGTSTVTLTVASTAATGTYPITITGAGGGITQTATVNLTVTVTPSFAVSASPTSVSVSPGSSGTSTVTTTVAGGFSAAVTLTASGQPSGVTVSFSPSSTIAAPGAGTTTVTFKVSTSAHAGTHTITIKAASGSTSHTTTVSLTVT
jgi:kumamolisin